MNSQPLDPRAGFQIANGGIDRNVALADDICSFEKKRIQVTNEPEITRLQISLDLLMRERRELHGFVTGAARFSASQVSWPVWQTIMAVVFIGAGFGFSLMSFEPFDLGPVLLWICSVGVACLCAYSTAMFLAKTNHKAVVLVLSSVLITLSIAGLAVLASVRGDLFALHVQNIPNPGEAGAAANQSGLAFYESATPKIRLFLTLLSLGLELAGGLAIHEIHRALKARPTTPSAESRRLNAIEIEIGQTEAHIRFLQNEPEAFAHEFRRNLCIGLLGGATRHAGFYRSWPVTFMVLAAVAMGPELRGQPIDWREGLDYSATSKATSYDGKSAHRQNIEAAARIIEVLPAGSQITVSAISDESFARPITLVSGKLPTSPGPLSKYDQIVAGRIRLAAALRRVGPTIGPDFQATDILGYLMATGMAFHDTPKMRHVVTLFSDMRQSASPLDIERGQVVSISSALATVERRHLFADLSGVDVFIYGVHAVGKDVAYWQSLRDFWAAYFRRCHANLRAFSMTRDTPDLGESR